MIKQLEHKNQFVIITDKGTYFQSYESIIAFYPNNGDKIRLGKDWKRSATTLKHLRIFLEDYCKYPVMKKSEIENAISNGKFIFDENLSID